MLRNCRQTTSKPESKCVDGNFVFYRIEKDSKLVDYGAMASQHLRPKSAHLAHLQREWPNATISFKSYIPFVNEPNVCLSRDRTANHEFLIFFRSVKK